MSPKAIGDGSADVIDLGVDERDQEIDALKAENRKLRRELSDAEVRADRAREDANRALSMLRRQLAPLYRALQAVFGELDAAGVTDAAPPTAATMTATAPVNDRQRNVYEPWLERFGRDSAQGRVVQALLAHGDLSVEQLRIAAQMAYSTAYEAAKRLKKLGLVENNGGKFSLKQL